jgi:hypothetical protein
VQNVDSIPKAIVRSRLVGRRRAKESVSLRVAGLQKSKGFETGVRDGVLVPKALNSDPKLRRVNNPSRVPFGVSRDIEVGGEGNRNRDMVSDVLATLVMVRECVDELVRR